MDVSEGTADSILSQVSAHTYQYKEGMGRDRRTHYGLIADEVAETDEKLVEYNDAGEIWNVDWNGITALLVEAVKGIWQKNNEQDERIAELEARLDALEKENKKLTN